MNTEERQMDYLSILHRETALALGCTEPAAALLLPPMRQKRWQNRLVRRRCQSASIS